MASVLEMTKILKSICQGISLGFYYSHHSNPIIDSFFLLNLHSSIGWQRKYGNSWENGELLGFVHQAHDSGDYIDYDMATHVNYLSCQDKQELYRKVLLFMTRIYLFWKALWFTPLFCVCADSLIERSLTSWVPQLSIWMDLSSLWLIIITLF